MKSLTLVAAVAVLAASVSAQAVDDGKGRIYYTEPIGSTVWTAGSVQKVTWDKTKPCDSQNAGKKLNIALYRNVAGKEQELVPGIGAIGTLDCVNEESTQVNIPANLTTGLYSIHVSTQPLQSYSASFTIKGIDPPVTSTAAPTTPATSAPAPVTTASAAPQTTETKTPSGASSLQIATSLVASLAVAVGALMA
ncbi:hypothetical protein BGZ73_000681 [Actinomortierella ambigua]|nr:hypothetical protein BGZ73_000681 [Actinomortierella ambigua]